MGWRILSWLFATRNTGTRKYVCYSQPTHVRVIPVAYDWSKDQ